MLEILSEEEFCVIDLVVKEVFKDNETVGMRTSMMGKLITRSQKVDTKDYGSDPLVHKKKYVRNQYESGSDLTTLEETRDSFTVIV